MNKQYITVLAAILIAGGATAQNSRALRSLKVPYDASAVRASTPGQAKGAVIWSNDFAAPSDWVITHDPNGFVVDWEIGIGIESTGQYGTPAILSTTAANGYAMMCSDCGNNSGSTYEQSFLTTAQSIDLSAYPNLVLQFETQYRRFNNEQTYIAISTDGVNWPVPPSDTATINLPTGLYPVWADGELSQSVSPGNPTIRRINISDAAGSQGAVWVRFYWYGVWGYAWYVDDVQIEEQPQYDVVMANGFVSHTGTGDEYGRIPSSQYTGSMNVGGEYTNPGVQDQTNVSVTADAGAFSANSSTALLQTDETILMDETVSATLAQQLYTCTFNVTSDQIAQDAFPDNNTYLRNFEITQDVYSLDGIDNHPAGYELLTSTGTNSFTDNSDQLFLLTLYHVATELDVYALEVVLANGTVEGGSIVASLHDTTEVLNDNVLSPLATSPEHIVTAADVAAGSAIVLFNGPATLSPGAYYAGVELVSNSNANDIRVLDDITVPQPGNASLISLASDGLTYGNGNAYALRLMSDPSIGIRENHELAGISLYPNPSEGQFTINATEAGSYLVDVTNMLGATVQSTRFNNTLNMDLTGLAKGVYTVRVSNDAASTVQKVTIR